MLKTGAKRKRTVEQMGAVAEEEQALKEDRHGFLLAYKQMKSGRNPQSAVKQQDQSFEKAEGAGAIYEAQHKQLQMQMETLQQQLMEKHEQE
jgi:hypothetical protein